MYSVYNEISISNKIKKEYKKRYCSDDDIMSLETFVRESNKRGIKYCDLPYTEVWGYPVGNKRNSYGELVYYFQDLAHELCCGTTRIGKTTGLLEPRLRALANKKNKPCLFLSDPKGELFMRNAKFLKEQGYKLFLLNFKDAVHSNQWNPLVPIYDVWIKLKDIDKRIEHHESLKDLNNYILQDEEELFIKGKEFWSVGNEAYADQKDAQRVIAALKAEIETDTAGMVGQLIATISGDILKSSKDPIWELGAQEILRGLIYLMLEDALDERSGFEREHMSFKTMQEYYSLIRSSIFRGSSTSNTMISLTDTRKLKHKSYSDESLKHLRPYLENAPATSRSYMGVFDNLMQNWFTPKMYSISTGHDIDVEGYEKQPFAVFLITRDYEKSDFKVAGLFIDWLYQQMVEKAEENSGVLKREMFFLCDEFGNIPKINDFSNKISTSLSRGIGFQLYVQSFAQIEAVYGAGEAQIIRDNCNAQTFLGSQNFQTKSVFSRECGVRTIPTLSAKLYPDVNQTQEVAVLRVRDLENLEPGQMYTKKIGLPVIKTQFCRAYLCEEFKCEEVMPGEMGFKSLPFTDEKFSYGYLSNGKTMAEQSGSKEELDLISDIFNIGG